jgi:hypothetical protein
MKSKFEFKTENDWNEYLVQYYAGLAMAAMLSNPRTIELMEMQTAPADKTRQVANQAVLYAANLAYVIDKFHIKDEAA